MKVTLVTLELTYSELKQILSGLDVNIMRCEKEARENPNAAQRLRKYAGEIKATRNKIEAEFDENFI